MRNKIIHLIILISVFCLSCINLLYGQGQNDIYQKYEVTPLAPEAASLAKMINYPVSYNTGVPDIRILLYTLEVGNLQLPIELVYHAGGFKINEMTGRAGLGWSLSCDLQITRSINGIDDFIPQLGYIGNQKVIGAKKMQEMNLQRDIHMQTVGMQIPWQQEKLMVCPIDSITNY